MRNLAPNSETGEASMPSIQGQNDKPHESIARRIEREVLGWPGTSAEPHRFGGIEFKVNHHEIGHLHGNHMADLPFPVRVRKELVASGRASLHHILPDTGWVSFYIRSDADVEGALDLFRMRYDRLSVGRAQVARGESLPGGVEGAE